MGAGDAGGSKGGSWGHLGVKKGLMEDMPRNRGTRGKPAGRSGWSPRSLGHRGGLGKVPLAPPSPRRHSPRLTQHFYFLLLPQTDEPRVT